MWDVHSSIWLVLQCVGRGMGWYLHMERVGFEGAKVSSLNAWMCLKWTNEECDIFYIDRMIYLACYVELERYLSIVAFRNT